MKVNGKHFRTVWLNERDEKIIRIIDQRHLPHKFVVEDMNSLSGAIAAIKDMHVRGAGLIGATAAYGMYLAALEANEDGAFDDYIEKAGTGLKSARPTAVNLSWAVDRQLQAIKDGKHSYPLQCRLAGICGLRYCHCSNLCCIR